MNYPYYYSRLLHFLRREVLKLIFPSFPEVELSYDQTKSKLAGGTLFFISDVAEKEKKSGKNEPKNLYGKNFQRSSPAILLSEDGQLKFGRVVKMRLPGQTNASLPFFSQNPDEKGSGSSPNATEEAFLHQLEKTLNEHLSDSSFTVEVLAREMAISRSKLYRKIKSLSGHSIAAYIRTFRLQRARRMLSDSDWSISEIAYEVGFNDPSYFSRTFMQEFGHSPRVWRMISRAPHSKRSAG